MSDIGEIAKALVKARIACGAIVKKSGKNQAQSYAYVGHEHVLVSGAREALLANGLVLLETAVMYQGELSYATRNGEQKCYRWRGEFALVHESGESMRLEFEATTTANDKAAYVASTALDRTAHLRVCCMAGSANEDPEHDEHDRFREASEKPERIAKSQKERLDAVARGGASAVERPSESRISGEQSARYTSPTTQSSAATATASPPSQTTVQTSAGSSGETVDTSGEVNSWLARNNNLAHAAFEFSGIARGEMDDLGLIMPSVPIPRFSAKAKKHANALYTEVPAGFIRDVIMQDEKFSQQPMAVQLWCVYSTARHELKKMEVENG